jgi:hypothetical protein
LKPDFESAVREAARGLVAAGLLAYAEEFSPEL